MARWLPTFLPRIAVLVLVALAATAGLTFAAGSQVPSAPPVPAVNTTPAPPMIVPDVRNQAFVFAKGTLTDSGFAWRVAGSVQGYAANIVASQSPAAGTPVIDTGAPLITLTLKRNSSYTQAGDAADTSPYAGTAVEPSDLSGNPIGPARVAKTPAAAKKAKTSKKHAAAKKTAAATTPAVTTPAVTTPAVTTPATTTPAVTTPETGTTPATTTPATTTPATTTPAKTTAAATPAAPAKAAKYPQHRPVAFTVAGAHKEPLDEMPLPDRAALLGTWLDKHQTKSAAAAQYWLYQNEWIVTGAQMGWWRGAEALQTLIAVDRRTQTLWGIGAKSAAVAQQALDEVRAKAKS